MFVFDVMLIWGVWKSFRVIWIGILLKIFRRRKKNVLVRYLLIDKF